jgi:hypothetical protein
MNQHSTNASSNYLLATNNDRSQYLNAQQAYHYQQPQPLSVITRSLAVSAYCPSDAHYDTDSQTDNYMLSPATSMGAHDPYENYGLHDGNRNWPASNNRYMSYYSRYGEHDPASYQHGSMNPPRRPTALFDGSSGTFSTSALQMSLPVPGARVLPPPTADARAQFQAHTYDMTQMRPTTSTSAAGNISLSSYAKPTQNWATGQATSGARNDSVASSRSSDITAPLPQKPSSASSSTSENSTLTLLSSSSASPDISPTTATTTDQAVADNSLTSHHDLVITPSEHPIYAMPTASASDTRLQHTGTASGLYTFTIAKRQHPHSELITSEDRQIGNSSYVPLQYPPESSNRVSSINSFCHDSADGRTHGLPHRGSMPTISQDS